LDKTRDGQGNALAGNATDVYVVFQRMLRAGNPPDRLEALMKKVKSGK
jgi:hypothetical protein